VRHDATGKQAKVLVDLARIVAGKDAEMKQRYGFQAEPQVAAQLHMSGP